MINILLWHLLFMVRCILCCRTWTWSDNNLVKKIIPIPLGIKIFEVLHFLSLFLILRITDFVHNNQNVSPPNWSIYPSTHPRIHPFIHLSTNKLICHQSVQHLPIHYLINPPTHLYTHPSFHSPTHSPIHPFIPLTIHPSISLPTYLPIIHQSICLYNHSLIHLQHIHLSIYSPTQLSFHSSCPSTYLKALSKSFLYVRNKKVLEMTRRVGRANYTVRWGCDFELGFQQN